MKQMVEKILNDPDSLISKITVSVILAIGAFFGGNFFLTGGFWPELAIPFGYGGDSLLILDVIKRVAEESWYFFTDKMGFPFGSYLYDYAIPDFGSLLILKIISKITGSYAIAYNLYFLLGFSVTAVVTYLVLLKMKLNQSLCIVGALLFDFVPFHILRLGHLFYTWYFVAPIFFYYCFKIFSANPPFMGENNTKKATIIDIIMLLIGSAFGVYYAFFGAMLLAVSGVAAAVYNKTRKNLFSALIACAIVVAGIIAITAPNICHTMVNGKNTEVGHRGSIESEIYGLKIASLLLPHPGHRSKLLARVADGYNASSPLVNENVTASVGLVGFFGFILLMLVVFFGPFAKSAPRNDEIMQPRFFSLLTDQRLKILALLTAFMVLFMTIGGFSSLFAKFVNPSIRAWNRGSIFIAFAAITAFLIGLKIFIDATYKPAKIPLAMFFYSSIVFVFGMWDQTFSTAMIAMDSNKVVFLRDQNFVQKIENFLPKNSAVFQLPFMRFPEVSPINALGDYMPSIGYLHSKTLKWSYGTIRGRAGDWFYQALADQPLDKQIEIIKKLGFSGIYIDRRGYADQGIAIEKALTKIINTKALFESDDKLIAFYKLPGAKVVSFDPKKPLEIMRATGLIVDKLGMRYKADLKDGIDFKKQGFPEFVKDVHRLYKLKPWGRQTLFSRSKKIEIDFYDKLPQDFTLIVKMKALGSDASQSIKVLVGNEEQDIMLSPIMSEYRLPFHNNAASSTIVFFIPQAVSPSGPTADYETRDFGIGFEKLLAIPGL